MTAPSDTPMTDDAWWRGDCEDEQLININHARTLERELDAATARAKAAKADHARAVDVSSRWEDRCLKAEAERDEARAERDALVQATGSSMLLEAIQIIRANKAELDRLTTLRPASEWDKNSLILLFDERGKFAGNRDQYSGTFGSGIPSNWCWTPIPTSKEPTP